MQAAEDDVPENVGDEERDGAPEPAPKPKEVDHALDQLERGEITVVLETLPPLPDDATEPERRIYDLCRKLFAVRRYLGLHRKHPAAIITQRWLAQRLEGLHETTAWRALATFRNLGILVQDETMKGRGARGALTFLPGPLKQPEPSGDADVGTEGFEVVRVDALSDDGIDASVPGVEEVAPVVPEEAPLLAGEWLDASGAEPEDVLPAVACAVEADGAAGVDQGQEVGEDVPVG